MVVIDDEGFGVEREAALTGCSLHVAAAVFSVGAEFVEIGAVIDKTGDVVPVGGVGRSVVVGAEGIGENADLDTAIFGTFYGGFEFGGGDEISGDKNDFRIGAVNELAEFVGHLHRCFLTIGRIFIGRAIDEKAGFPGDSCLENRAPLVMAGGC